MLVLQTGVLPPANLDHRARCAKILGASESNEAYRVQRALASEIDESILFACASSLP